MHSFARTISGPKTGLTPLSGTPAKPSAEPQTNTVDIDDVQLARLAKAVLSKDSDDLAALATTNPLLIREWQIAFRQQHALAEKEARYWAAAAAALATLKGMSFPDAAE